LVFPDATEPIDKDSCPSGVRLLRDDDFNYLLLTAALLAFATVFLFCFWLAFALRYSVKYCRQACHRRTIAQESSESDEARDRLLPIDCNRDPEKPAMWRIDSNAFAQSVLHL